MQGIKAWARANPQRLPELLNTNPSLVFFRELPLDGAGPQGEAHVLQNGRDGVSEAQSPHGDGRVGRVDFVLQGVHD